MSVSEFLDVAHLTSEDACLANTCSDCGDLTIADLPVGEDGACEIVFVVLIFGGICCVLR